MRQTVKCPVAKLRRDEKQPRKFFEEGGLAPEKRQAMQIAGRQRPAGIAAERTDLSVWHVHNRITAAAQRLDFSRRSRLERIGGALLSDASMN